MSDIRGRLDRLDRQIPDTRPRRLTKEERLAQKQRDQHWQRAHDAIQAGQPLPDDTPLDLLQTLWQIHGHIRFVHRDTGEELTPFETTRQHIWEALERAKGKEQCNAS